MVSNQTESLPEKEAPSPVGAGQVEASKSLAEKFFPLKTRQKDLIVSDWLELRKGKAAIDSSSLESVSVSDFGVHIYFKDGSHIRVNRQIA